MASRQRTIEQPSGSAPTIGVAVDERTHYAHARYAMSDEPGVIWFDPRDGRERFRVPGVPADVGLSLGERVLTHVSIHPKRACCQVVDPADHEWVVEYQIKTREVFERPPDLPDREYTAHYASSETYDTVRAARSAAGERCAAYGEAEYRNAVEERSGGELVTDGGTCHEPKPADNPDLPRTNAGTPLPELRFVDRFATDDDVFYAVTEENGVRLYRVTGETTIVRGLLAHDAVIHETAGDGAVTTPAYNEQYGTIDLYHHMGGREASLRADRILDEPVITLAEGDRV